MSKTSPTLVRILASVLYDTLILLALFMLTGFVVVPINQLITGSEVFTANWLMTLILYGVTFSYFYFSWRRGGQTIGMKSWRLRLQHREEGKTLTQGQLVRRFLVAQLSWMLLGLGYLWQLLDKEKLTLHGRWSDTRLEVLPKRKKR